MKYLNNYKSFMKSLDKEINKSSSMLESKLLSDLSKNFWVLSLESKIFNENEKLFIKENLMSYEVDMLNEGWFGDLWEWGKSLWKKGTKWVKEKIQQVIDNVSKFAKSVVSFIKSIIDGIKKYLKKTYTNLVNKNKSKIESDLKKDPESLKKEGSQFKETFEWMKGKFSESLFGKIDNNESNVEKNIEAVKESLLDFNDDNVDILYEFYIMNEGSGGIDSNDPNQVYDVTKSENKGSAFFMKWVLGVNAKQPADKKGKVVWWVSLIGKILGWVLNPVVKLFESVIKLASSKILQAASYLAKVLGGPGVYKFIFLGSVVAALVGTAIEATHVWHSHVFNFIPGLEEGGKILHHLFEFIGEATGINSLATIIGVVAFVLAVGVLIIEVIELIHDVKKKDTLSSDKVEVDMDKNPPVFD